MASILVDSGRRLEFAEWGDPRGTSVVYFHGSPGSRLECYPGPQELTELGIRLITFDRPGYGRSGPVDRWRVADCAADVERLVDHLGVERFSLSAFSAGGPFALATAWALGGRVDRVAVFAGVGPFDDADALAGMHDSTAREYSIARDDPERLLDVLTAENLALSMSDAEVAALDTVPGLKRALRRGVLEITRQGWAGVAVDDLALVRDWGFSLGDIGVPVHLWHGSDDSVIPIAHGERVAARVPGALLRRCPGERHFSMFGHHREALAVLVATR